MSVDLGHIKNSLLNFPNLCQVFITDITLDPGTRFFCANNLNFKNITANEIISLY